MFDNPKKELAKLEKQLLEDEEWFQRELDSAKRMIGQAPEKTRQTSAPRTVQASPARSTGSVKTTPQPQAVKEKAPVRRKKKSAKGLLILLCAEILGILGLAAYWLLVLLK